MICRRLPPPTVALVHQAIADADSLIALIRTVLPAWTGPIPEERAALIEYRAMMLAMAPSDAEDHP